MISKRTLPQLACFAVALAASCAARGETIGYNRQVRPILAKTCFACHGPDRAARKADLRLDQREAAVKAEAIVPGKPEDSEAIRRIFAQRADERMPPPASHKSLSTEEKELLKRWVAAGAEYQPHWSFLRPARPSQPAVKNSPWCRNAIDHFILAKLEENGLQPSPEADRRSLARRVTLDLTGLPPEPADVDAFLADPTADAYERLVDRLLSSVRWGEHRAHYWLDAARYADTHGLHFDNFRQIWPFRDWVIAAFNRNLPFDRFTIEQLAGDLLPDATVEQLTASGFNRCNITTNEGGTIPEENLVLYTRDRTETAARVWLGLTANCAVCHDHKFDPIPQRDFYRFSAFFNNTTQGALDGNINDTPPVLFLPAPADKARWAALEKEKPDAARQKEMAEIKARGTIIYVTRENGTPAKAHVLFRGEYDKRREEVEAGTFSCLPPMAAGLPKNRLGLARWLLAPENPLAARVTVNRFWQEIFGAGLVRTADDFGATGEAPSHPELLDWLAVEFRESGWDVKRLVRLMVTSAAYRQSAAATADKLQRDPQNVWLGRGPRFRMDAEMLRDYALAAGGLLSPKIGGPSVKPYQPPGVWEAVAMPESNTRFYAQDHGEGLYRRSLYTFWKRAAPPASMEILNAPSREFCTVRRERTNTPLQALVTLNDPQFVEAARHLAQRTLTQGGATPESRLDFLTKRVLARSLRAEEQAVAARLLGQLLDEYARHPDAAKQLLAVGESPADPSLAPPLLAAWTVVANGLLNLDEALNK